VRRDETLDVAPRTRVDHFLAEPDHVRPGRALHVSRRLTRLDPYALYESPFTPFAGQYVKLYFSPERRRFG
jgi:hypothetical protein